MFGQSAVRRIALIAVFARVRLLAAMRPHVLGNIGGPFESARAQHARIVFHVHMNSAMARQIARCRKGTGAGLTHVRPDFEVNAHVHFQMEFSAEAGIANIATEIFDAGVRDTMSPQRASGRKC